jgi:peptidoglycan/xylan/chitin deacetylase (PgdA/CDA1 family)
MIRPTARTLLRNTGLLLCQTLSPRAPVGGVAVLGYHAVNDSGSTISISPAMLACQMDVLQDLGYQGISLRECIKRIADGEPAIDRTVVLTFDDGLRCFAKEVCPILERHSFGATSFVPIDFIGGNATWYANHALETFPMMTWNEIVEATDRGFDIQSHGCSHRRLPTLDATELKREIVESRDVLQQHLGAPVDLFCPPYGETSPRVSEALRDAGYAAAVTVEQGHYSPGGDPMSIPRMSLDYVSILDPSTARLAMRGCLDGTYRGYVNLKKLMRSRLGRH